MIKKTGLIKGNFTWTMGKQRVSGNVRIVMVIRKGETVVAFLCWHPASKCIIFDGLYDCTPKLIDFVRPFMEKKQFYKMWKIHNILN